MSDLKRYDDVSDPFGNHGWQETKDGEWVKYEDAEKMERALAVVVEALQRIAVRAEEVAEMDDPRVAVFQEMAEEALTLSDTPEHGRKG